MRVIKILLTFREFFSTGPALILPGCVMLLDMFLIGSEALSTFEVFDALDNIFASAVELIKPPLVFISLLLCLLPPAH